MLFPASGEGLVVALRAYFDASNREQSDVYCLAGVAFGVSNAKKASRDWKRLFADKTFHMTDLNARRGDFKGVSDEEVDRYMRGAVDVIRKYASTIIMTSFCPKKVVPHLPQVASGKFNKAMLLGFQNPYALSCRCAMQLLGEKTQNQIYYTFEMGDDGQGSHKKYVEAICAKPHLQDSYFISGHSYKRKSEEVLLGTSDLVAWEWTKHLERQAAGKPIRKSLAAIIGQNSLNMRPLNEAQDFESDRVIILHLAGEFIEKGLALSSQLMGTDDEGEWRSILQGTPFNPGF